MGMKRHTNKNLKIFGSLISILAMVALLGSFAMPTWAVKSNKAEADVQFTINPTLTVQVSGTGTTDLGTVQPMQTKEASAFTVTVGTNNAAGFYLSATSGTTTTSDLKADGVAGYSIKHLASTDAGKATVGDLSDNSWAVKVTGGLSAVSTGKYIGLPQEEAGDTATKAAAGTKLLDANNASGNKQVGVQVGVKLGMLPPGTYTGQLNFYAVTK